MAQGNNLAGKLVSPGPTVVNQFPCLLKSLYAYNHTTAIKVVQIFDMARKPILGTDTPLREFPVPGASGADQGTNWISPNLAEGLALYNGLAYAVVTAIGGSTPAASTDLVGHLDYTSKT